jgi:MFS family permease
MTASPETGARGSEPGLLANPGGQLFALGLLALWIMAPVTLPVPVLRELVQERFGVSEFLTSLFMSINMLGALLMAPLAGGLVDRWGRGKAILVSALCLDALCFLLLASPIPFSLFLFIRFIEGCAHITALSILLTLAANALPADQRGRAMGIVGGCMMFGVAIGAPLGGVLGQRGPILPLIVGAGLACLGALLAALMVRENLSREMRPTLSEMRQALRAQPALLAPLAFAFADRFTVGFFTTTFSLYLGNIHQLASARIGMAIAIFMLPFALFSYPFGRLAEKASVTTLLCVGSLLYGVGTAWVGFMGPPQLYGLMLFLGVAAAVMFVPSLVLTTHLASGEIRATALGAFNAAGSLGFIFGPLAGGAISETVARHFDWSVGYQVAFAVAGASELICVAVALPFLLRMRGRGLIT